MATAGQQRSVRSASTELSLAIGGAAVIGAGLVLTSAEMLGATGIAVALLVYAAVSCFAWPRARANGLSAFGAANSMTLARAALTSVLAGCAADIVSSGLVPPSAIVWLMLSIALVAFATDACDGWLARRLHTESRFGARFDMETDAVLTLVLSVLAWILGKAGVWILAVGLMRYSFVAAGVAWPALAAPLPPSFRRKLVCVVQISALILILAPQIEPPASAVLAAGALAAVACSFTVDVAWLVAAARRPKRAAS